MIHVEILRNNRWYGYHCNGQGAVDVLMDLCRNNGIVADNIRIDGQRIPLLPHFDASMNDLLG